MPRYVEKGSQKPTDKQPLTEPAEKAPATVGVDEPEVPKEAQKPRKKYIEKGPDYKEPAPKEPAPEGTIEPKEPKEQKPKEKKATNPEKKDNPKTKKFEEPIKGKKHYQQKKDNDRPYRNFRRSKYNWNRRNITLETVVPDMPKNILKKPDEAALDKKIKNINEEIKKHELELKEKKETKFREIKAAREEKTSFNKLSSANLAKLRQFQSELRKQRSHFGDLVKSQKAMIVKLKELRNQDSNFRGNAGLEYKSEAELKSRKDHLENTLITKELTVKERKKIQDEINECGRHLVNARQEYELDLEHGKIRDIIKLEQEQLNKLNAEINEIRQEITRLENEIKAIESINESEEKVVQKVRSREEIEEEYEQERQSILDTIYRLEDEINSLEDTYRYELDDYREQAELIEWIKFAEDEKKYIKEENERREREEKERKAEQERRKKERERELAEKQKKKEQWEKKKKEREEREKRYQEELDKKLNSLPFDDEKKLCSFLKEYCQKLKPKTDEETDNKEKPKGEVVLTGDWLKETKKGAKLIRNKKEQEEENELDITKNIKKPEKKVEKKVVVEDAPFDHTIHMIRLFENIHVPPPAKLDSIDQTIEAIDKRLEYYQNPSEEDIKKHREKVAAEHNQGAFGHSNGEPKPERKHEKVEKEHRPPRLAESDFPAL